MDLRVNTDPFRPGRRKPGLIDHEAPPCTRCGEFRPAAAVRDADPFCSAVCCRLEHGCPVAGDEPVRRELELEGEHGVRGYHRGCRCETCTARMTADRSSRRRSARARARGEQVAA